ncbi:hypothetical protein Elgi_40710 [Paenibacillus elgii]|nr:hypothetical protein Elgi_40710 [Paenibacillus elgii]
MRGLHTMSLKLSINCNNLRNLFLPGTTTCFVLHKINHFNFGIKVGLFQRYDTDKIGLNIFVIIWYSGTVQV